MKFRVMTYNVQHFHPYKAHEQWEDIDYRPFADVIRMLDPDVVGLNEVRGEGVVPYYAPQAKLISDMTGYHAFFAPSLFIPDHGLYGNAFLCKKPLEKAEIVKIPDPVTDNGYVETRSVAKTVLPYAGGITMLTSHFGLTPLQAKNAVEVVCEEIRKSTLPVILTGDFNVTPDDPVLDPIRALLRDTADLFGRPLLSFPSDEPKGKIDYIFCSKELHPTFATIPPLVLSDHRPYVADFEL